MPGTVLGTEDSPGDRKPLPFRCREDQQLTMSILLKSQVVMSSPRKNKADNTEHGRRQDLKIIIIISGTKLSKGVKHAGA